MKITPRTVARTANLWMGGVPWVIKLDVPVGRNALRMTRSPIAQPMTAKGTRGLVLWFVAFIRF
jgi:hypothetical protein